MDKNEIIIKDITLEKAIRDQLNIFNRDIFKEDICNLKRLNCAYMPGYNGQYLCVKDLTGLEFAENLETLEIRISVLNNVDILKNCKKLKRLYLYFEKSESLDSVLSLNTLTKLDLSWKNISRMSTFQKNNTKISYTRLLTYMFSAIRLGINERHAIEKFYFSQSKKNAIEAIRKTPRAAVFVKDYLSDKEILDEIKSILIEPNTPIQYAKNLMKLVEYKDKLGEIISSHGSSKVKKLYMEFVLKN